MGFHNCRLTSNSPGILAFRRENLSCNERKSLSPVMKLRLAYWIEGIEKNVEVSARDIFTEYLLELNPLTYGVAGPRTIFQDEITNSFLVINETKIPELPYSTDLNPHMIDMTLNFTNLHVAGVPLVNLWKGTTDFQLSLMHGLNRDRLGVIDRYFSVDICKFVTFINPPDDSVKLRLLSDKCILQYELVY
jgi:hypothetical protein